MNKASKFWAIVYAPVAPQSPQSLSRVIPFRPVTIARPRQVLGGTIDRNNK